MGKCYNSAVINAPCEKVWESLRNFHDLSWASAVIDKTVVVGDCKGDQIGATRLLNDAFEETLLSLDDRKHTFSYKINDGPEPLSSKSVEVYIGWVRVFPITENDTTFIEWQSTYDSVDNRAVHEFCNPIYQALLKSLKDYFA